MYDIWNIARTQAMKLRYRDGYARARCRISAVETRAVEGRKCLKPRQIQGSKAHQLGRGEWRIPRPHTYCGATIGRPAPPNALAAPAPRPPKNQPTNRCHHGRRGGLAGEERDGRFSGFTSRSHRATVRESEACSDDLPHRQIRRTSPHRGLSARRLDIAPVPV
jgi:hypothetical protein